MLNRNEKKILKSGKYVAVPVNLQLLLSPSELYVLNAIRHYNNIGVTELSRISVSLLTSSTGLSKQTVLNALKGLVDLGVIQRLNYSSSGSLYKVLYERWGKALDKLNAIPNPTERLELAKKLKINKLQ